MRSRWVLPLALLFVLIALESGLRIWRGPRVQVVIENRTGHPIRALSVGTPDRQRSVPTLADGGRLTLDALASEEAPLLVSYRDSEGRPQSLELSSFEGKRLLDEGLRLGVVLLPDGLVADENEDSPTPSAGLKRWLANVSPVIQPFPF
ncbi:hypothetical protein [Tautonia sociabilis]|uniref:Uncharacterized protein n=1 Tax=Tautonia sociabilis TaxID=2080755 RepID=A0A432ML82_9BACT|nr:hypothetical protein [Tautonia sociabilis]RUL88184.1 hypothetical protein TsocGM_08590 [Tautonia sociabilis]